MHRQLSYRIVASFVSSLPRDPLYMSDRILAHNQYYLLMLAPQCHAFH